MNKIIPYRRDLKMRARELRNNQTEAEIIVWNALRRRSLSVQFHRQVPMLDYIVDFYCHEIGLAIEIDGLSHETQVLEDGLRSGRLEKYGVHFLRFTNKEVFNDLQIVLNKVKERISEYQS